MVGDWASGVSILIIDERGVGVVSHFVLVVLYWLKTSRTWSLLMQGLQTPSGTWTLGTEE